VHVKRIAWIIFAVIIVITPAWVRRTVSAQIEPLRFPYTVTEPLRFPLHYVGKDGPGLTMQVTVGFDGYCRSDCWCPVYVVLSNEQADVQGELRAIVPNTGDNARPHVYARPVVLPAHSRKAYSLYLPFAGSRPPSKLDVQLVAGEDVLSSWIGGVRWLDEGDWLHGVVGGSPSSINLLGDVAPAGGNAAVAHLSLETLPLNPLGWEGLDMLVLNDVDTTALTRDQRQALETWVIHGGHLIVGGGAGAARTVAGVTDLLPVTVGGVRSVDELHALSERLRVPAVAGPYAVAEATLRTGEVLIEQRDEQGEGAVTASLPLLARRTYGAGMVDFLAFDAGLQPFARWDDNVLMWESIVEVGHGPSERLLIRAGDSAHDAIDVISGLELPPALQLLAFMLVYTRLIGPANYLVLRRLDRRELAWLTIPLIVLGFTAWAYMTGFRVRGSRAIVHRLAVVYVPSTSLPYAVEGSEAAPSVVEGSEAAPSVVEGSEAAPSLEGAGGGDLSSASGRVMGRMSQVVGLFSPRRTDYDVRVVGAGVREVPSGYYSAPSERPLRVVEDAQGSTVNDLRVDIGGIQPFLAEGYVDVSSVEADLCLAAGAGDLLLLEGMLRTGGTALQEAVLLVGDREQRLGDLEPGQVISISTVLGPRLPPLEDLPERILGSGNYWDDQRLYQRYRFLQAVFPFGEPSALGSGVCLVGWAEEDIPLPAEVVDRPFSTVETALYVYRIETTCALPAAGLETGGTITIPPGLIVRQVEETDGYVDAWQESVHLEPGTAVVFRFAVWPGFAVRQVEELVLDMQGQGYGYGSGLPFVWLWNRQTGSWQKQDVDWGQYSVPNPGAYVSPSGEVRLRLEASEEWSADVETLTITIRGRQ
jgi:hypothetical protein